MQVEGPLVAKRPTRFLPLHILFSKSRPVLRVFFLGGKLVPLSVGWEAFEVCRPVLKVLGNVVTTILLRPALPSLEQNFSEVQLGLFELGQRETKLDFRFLLKFPFYNWAAAAPLDPLNAYFSSSSSSSATCVCL